MTEQHDKPEQTPEDGPVTMLYTPVRLDYMIHAGRELSGFLRGMEQRRIVGRRCPSCSLVYVPPRGACPTCGVSTASDAVLSGAGTITTFCVVHIPFEGQRLPPPYACGWVLLDGADSTLLHIVGNVPVEEVRMGMRVKPVWVPDEELGPTLEAIAYFEPSGEPDAPFDSYKEHL
ncbi:MAG: Zn-ribbon domain-containing OB-fold protein [Myxococcota bacterium]